MQRISFDLNNLSYLINYDFFHLSHKYFYGIIMDFSENHISSDQKVQNYFCTAGNL